MNRLFSLGIAALVAIVLTIIIAAVGCGTIEEGNAGLVFNWEGKYTTALEPGLYVKPFARVEKHTLKEVSIPLRDMRPKAADNLSMADLDVDVMYRVTSKEALARLAIKRAGQSIKPEGGDYLWPAYLFVQSAAESKIADAISKFDSLVIHQNRNALAEHIKTSIQEALDASDPGDFQITRVIVLSAMTDPSVEASIRRVVNKQKEKEAADLEEGIQRALAEANKQKTLGLSPTVLQEKYLDAMATCAANQHCTMIIDGTTATKILNINN